MTVTITGPGPERDRFIHAQVDPFVVETVLDRAAVDILQARSGGVAEVHLAIEEGRKLRAVIEERISELQGMRRDAVRRNSQSDLHRADVAIDACEFDRERLLLMTSPLPERLEQAQANERRRQGAIAAQTVVADQAIGAFRKALTGYAKHAQAIVDIVQLGEAAHTAREALRTLGCSDLPDISDTMGNAYGRPTPLHALVALPNPPGTPGMMVGEPPAALRPAPHGLYAVPGR